MFFFSLFKANFTIYVDSNLNACPKENSVNMTIFPEGLEDRVQIMLDYNCECDCQREPEAVSLNLSLYPSVRLSICLSLSIYLSIYPSIYLSIAAVVQWSVCLTSSLVGRKTPNKQTIYLTMHAFDIESINLIDNIVCKNSIIYAIIV